MDISTVVAVAGIVKALWDIGSSIYNGIQGAQEEQQEKETLAQIKQYKEQQIDMDIQYIQNVKEWKLYTLDLQLNQARRSVLLEMYERYKQGLADRAIAIVSNYAAGVQGGAAKAQEIAAKLDADKDISIMSRNLFNIAKQLGMEKEMVVNDVQKTIANLQREKQMIEKASSLQELELAQRYRNYYAQWASVGIQGLSDLGLGIYTLTQG